MKRAILSSAFLVTLLSSFSFENTSNMITSGKNREVIESNPPSFNTFVNETLELRKVQD